MVFSSTIFIFFFLPIALAGYTIAPGLKWKNIWLTCASLFFYFWGGYTFFPIIVFSIVLNYVSGRLIDLTEDIAKKCILIGAVALNLANLGYWKYAEFIMGIVRSVTHIEFDIPEILLPIGISFFTFQGMSYVIDVYRGNAKVQKDFLKLALYISLFPQLIAGPIVRYTEVEKQLSNRTHSPELVVSGIRLFTIGLAKKAIIANSLAAVCDPIMDASPEGIKTGVAWVGVIFYTLQIYFDFSGYSDMAVGLGKMFGFEFPANFNYPYISKGPGEFWRRWHMSLSGWFRDYVYIPLGGSRSGNVYLHLFIVFLITGIWHGASWNMIVWGIYWGIMVVAERWIRYHAKKDIAPSKFGDATKWCVSTLITVVGWVFFRVNGITEALNYLGTMVGMHSDVWKKYDIKFYIHRYEIFILIVAIIAMLPIGKSVLAKIKEKVSAITYTVLVNVCTLLLLGISIMYVVTETYNPFIYFQF